MEDAVAEKKKKTKISNDKKYKARINRDATGGMYNGFKHLIPCSHLNSNQPRIGSSPPNALYLDLLPCSNYMQMRALVLIQKILNSLVKTYCNQMDLTINIPHIPINGENLEFWTKTGYSFNPLIWDLLAHIQIQGFQVLEGL